MVSRTRHRSNLAEPFDGLRNDYAAAKSSRYRRRRTGVAPTGSGADYHYRNDGDYLRLMEQARDMDRNDVVIGQAVDRLLDNVLQEGFQLDVQCGDKKLNTDLWQRFHDWATDPEQCDIAGESNFHQQERLALRHVIVDGDITALPLKTGELQLNEAHRLRTPKNTTLNVVHGVLLNQYRRRLQYWFTKDDIDPLQPLKLVSEITQVRARDDFNNRQVFHIYNPKRISQTRGVSSFAPIFDMLGMYEDVNFAMLVKQQVSSCWAILRSRAADFPGGPSPDNGERQEERTIIGGTRVVDGVAPGMEIEGQPGEQVEGFSPNIPAPQYFDHAKLILTHIANSLNMPLVMLLLDAKETNFSGWRGAIDQARISFRETQRWFTARFHREVYKWKVRQWIDQDKALERASRRRGVDLFAHRWNPPTWAYIEPLKDAEGDAFRKKELLISPRRLAAERGGDNDELMYETVHDNFRTILLAIRGAQRLKKITQVDVDWHELLWISTEPKQAKPAPGQPAGKEQGVAA